MCCPFDLPMSHLTPPIPGCRLLLAGHFAQLSTVVAFLQQQEIRAIPVPSEQPSHLQKQSKGHCSCCKALGRLNLLTSGQTPLILLPVPVTLLLLPWFLQSDSSPAHSSDSFPNLPFHLQLWDITTSSVAGCTSQDRLPKARKSVQTPDYCQVC